MIVADPVPLDAPGAREIGFSVPDRYNASAILFDNLDRGQGERIALRGPAGTLTYRLLCEEACRAGNALLSLNLARGERVLMLLDDTPAYPAFFFGAVRAGLVPVLVNTLSNAALLDFYVEDTGARVAVAEAALASRLGDRLEHRVLVNGAASGAADAKAIDASSWLPRFGTDLPAADTHRDEMAFWMYSSGSTGRPKGIVHLQHDMAYTAQAYARPVLRLTQDDICFSVPKIFFAYGLGNSLTFPFAAGASAVLMPGRGEPAAVFARIAEDRPTVFFGLPTLYTALVNDAAARRASLGSLRLCISAAEVLSNEVAASWRALSGLDIVEGLGSTEMLHIYLSNTPDAHRPGSAGRRVPGYELELCDAEGTPVGGGAEGILRVRGQSSAPLYWNRPEKTAETMRESWIWTGDRFQRDGDGFYFFRGRADDLIKVSGQWVWPLEVELCLAEHKAIREVAVMGIELPDRRMTLKAWVVPADRGADHTSLREELQRYVKQKLLPYKYPRLVEFRAALPKTGTGKVDRQALLKNVGG